VPELELGTAVSAQSGCRPLEQTRLKWRPHVWPRVGSGGGGGDGGSRERAGKLRGVHRCCSQLAGWRWGRCPRGIMPLGVAPLSIAAPPPA
jgi:hypothetical protein